VPSSPPVEEVVDLPEKFTLQDVPVAQARIEPTSSFVFYTVPEGPAADRFRLLRMRLQEPWRTRKIKTLLITSPLPHDGKSTVAVNLATALCEHGKRTVLLIEGDLHHPQLTEVLGIEPTPAGFGECLERKMDPLGAIRRIEPLAWYFLPAGTQRANATELLQTSAVMDILQNLGNYFDWILIDSPPVLPLTDALSLRQQANAALLVVRADVTQREAVEEAVALIGKQHILGIVLNGVQGLHGRYSKYGYSRANGA
jgi:capsular exopolysaccharide synthesis family protein